VPNVEAQRGAWQDPKDLSQVGNRLSHWLALIHVFDTEKLQRSVHGIWMDDDRPPTLSNLFQDADGNGLKLGLHQTGRVKGLVFKSPQIQAIQLLNQPNQFLWNQFNECRWKQCLLTMLLAFDVGHQATSPYLPESCHTPTAQRVGLSPRHSKRNSPSFGTTMD